MSEGQRGFCFVRGVSEGELISTTYGRASGFCIDPIEKKPLAHFYPGTSVLSFGTAGCNLGCKFCQNWSITKAREMETLADEASPEEIAEAAVEAGAKSVAFTYNDPVIFIEYAMDVAAACQARDVRTVAVTAGYITSRARPAFFADMDAANVDLKAFSERFYEKLCFASLGPVLETLEWLAKEQRTWFEVTTLLIPGENDSDDEVKRLAAWLAAHCGEHVPLHLSAFHPDFELRDRSRTPVSTLLRARELALSEGLAHVYTGNVHDPASQGTRCAACDELLIERSRYELGAWRLNAEGACPGCGAALAGHFDATPGSWGSKHRRLTIL